MAFENLQIFTDTYPPEAASWCNSRQTHYIKEIDPLDGHRRFQIVEIPKPTAEELAAIEARRKEAEEQASRLPDLEAAVAELGEVAAADKEETDSAAVDLAAYAAELEARIAKLEEKNNG